MKPLALMCSLLLILGTLAQEAGFPRTVTDLTGAAVTLPARPLVIAVIGDDPVLARLAAADLRGIDPAADAVDWRGIGLLVIPDLYAAAYPALIDSAEAARVPVFRTVPITSLGAWRYAVQQLGQATGREDRAARWVRRLDRRLALIRAWTRDAPPVRVVVLTPEGYTFGRGTLITDLIAAAGGINAAADAGFADYRQIDDPTLRALAPDVVLLSPAWSASASAAFAAFWTESGLRVYRLPFSPTQPGDPGLAALLLAVLLHHG